MNEEEMEEEELVEIIDASDDEEFNEEYVEIEQISQDYIEPSISIDNSSFSTNKLNNNVNNISDSVAESTNVPSNMPSASHSARNIKNKGNSTNVPDKLKNLKNLKNLKDGKGVSTSSSPNKSNNLSEKKEDNLQKNKQSIGDSSSSKTIPGKDESKKAPLNDATPWGDAKNKKDFVKENAGTAAKAAANIVAGNKVEGAIDIAKIVVNYIKKFWKKYAIMFIGAILAIIIIFFAIMSPILENMDKYKKYIEGFTDLSESTSNMYSGIGFKTTDEAFFEELETQFNLANGEVDLPLVMSALLYTETTNDYSTNYADTGEEKGALDTLKTILQEYGGASKYTQGQILRARMLSKAMTQYNEGEKVTLGEFVAQYGDLLKQNIESLKDPTWAMILTASNPFTVAVEQFKTTFNLVFGPTFVTASGEQTNALAELFETVLMGRKSITGISFGLEEDGSPQIYVVMQTKKYSEDTFKSFLSGYYIKRMPEFKPLLNGLTGTALDNEIDRIIKEIYDHRDWYKDIYGDIEGSSEEYEYTCIGGISPDLVSELGLPVKVTASSLTFTGEYSFGIVNSKMHNGIDLNSETTGTKEGDDVFAIANGTITDIVSNVSCNTANDSSCDEKGSWIKLKHSLMVDGTTFEFYSVYMNLQANSTNLKKGDKVQKGAVIGKAGKTGDTSISQVHFEFHNENDTPIDPTNLFIPCTSGGLVGSDNAEKIWFYFRNLGYSEISTAAAIGNFNVESGLDPTTVQGDYLQPDPDKYNRDYTNKVDNGTISKNDFIYHGPGGGGYGLIQWTYHPSKKALYEYMQKEKTSIGDLGMQLGLLNIQINDNAYWNSTNNKNIWKNASNISELNSATTAFMKGFEKPGIPHLDKRQAFANEIYNKYKGKKAPSSSTVQSSNNKIIASAKEIKEYIANNGYTYGGLGVEVRNAKNSRTVDCSSYVSWVLYNAGYDQFGGYQQVASTFNKNNWGFKEVSKSDVKPGDILVFGEVHVEIYAGMEGETTKVYNAGSNGAIKNPGVTNSSRGLNATTKILRP